MKITRTQMPGYLLEVIKNEIAVFDKKASVTNVNTIPATPDIPIENPNHWLKIPDVICVFVDMKGSTKLSASTHERSTASAYQLFTTTAVKMFHALDAPYIDVRGDGVFALFNADQPYRAFVAAVAFKTFAKEEFQPRIKDLTDLVVGCHTSIDQKTLLVRKVGLKRVQDRTDRQNEVWAGKTVNMASKLASIGDDNELLVSDRFFKNLKDERVMKSCGCNVKTDLWQKQDVTEHGLFDFNTAYKLISNWCAKHGETYFNEILALDRN